ncbi:MAG: ParB/RepB/Spo0J family partition protein [Gemmiger sp.]|nr:ParB/RepB/Spo0J family partition protein [Gemmiger sp.]
MYEKQKQKNGRVLMLPVEAIEPSPYQARTAFDDTDIAALAVSILQNGLLQPISVRRIGLKRYQLVAGERRLRACRLAKLPKVPAILAEYDDSETAALGLLENIQRSQLDPFDTARGIREVIRLWGCTQAEAARRLGLSQPALANKLRLLSLTGEQQDICNANHLSERHARAALRLPESRRTAALQKMARDHMSVREADRLVETMLHTKPGEPSPCRHTVPMVKDVRFFVNTLQHAVDMMTQKGIQATTTCGRRDGCLEYIVRIPVNATEGESPPVPALPTATTLPGGMVGPLRPLNQRQPQSTLGGPGGQAEQGIPSGQAFQSAQTAQGGQATPTASVAAVANAVAANPPPQPGQGMAVEIARPHSTEPPQGDAAGGGMEQGQGRGRAMDAARPAALNRSLSSSLADDFGEDDPDENLDDLLQEALAMQEALGQDAAMATHTAPPLSAPEPAGVP